MFLGRYIYSYLFLLGNVRSDFTAFFVCILNVEIKFLWKECGFKCAYVPPQREVIKQCIGVTLKQQIELN